MHGQLTIASGRRWEDGPLTANSAVNRPLAPIDVSDGKVAVSCRHPDALCDDISGVHAPPTACADRPGHLRGRHRVLDAVALLATYIPALRATCVPPMTALRPE